MPYVINQGRCGCCWWLRRKYEYVMIYAHDGLEALHTSGRDICTENATQNTPTVNPPEVWN
jgi:hypothetical protein